MKKYYHGVCFGIQKSPNEMCHGFTKSEYFGRSEVMDVKT